MLPQVSGRHRSGWFKCCRGNAVRAFGRILAPLAVATPIAAVLLAAQPVHAADTAPRPDISAVVRCVNGSFQVLSDAGHRSDGVAKVVTTSGYIDVYYSRPWVAVGSMQVTGDDTYATSGYVFGASVGLSYVRIVVAHDGRRVSPASACLAWSNIWITGWES